MTLPWRATELDRLTVLELRDRIATYEGAGLHPEPRRYPGYPRWALERARARPWVGLEAVLHRRRCRRSFSSQQPPRRTLSRLLRFAHEVVAEHGRGPVPSAGGLQALELYMVALTAGWLPAGVYHYDRAGHHLSQLGAGADRHGWLERVPALHLVEGGALIWILVGDTARVEAKYGDRGARFLLLEAGHLMQNLCLLSEANGWCTVPLGGALEGPIAAALDLLPTDAVLYVGVCGRPQRGGDPQPGD